MFAFAVFSAGLHFLIVKPATHEIAAAEMLRATAQVDAEFKDLVGQAERILGTAREWGEGEFDLFNVRAFNRLFMPVLANRPLLTSVYVSDDKGRQVLLERLPGGTWTNRLSDVEKWGTKRRQLTWSGTEEPPREDWLGGDYDPRMRPWYIGAQSLSRKADVYWTDPYIFFTSKEPGITASVKYHGARPEEVTIFAFDVKLINLSRFISTLKVGERGLTALLTHEGKIVGVTAPGVQSDDDIRRVVLKSPAEAGFSRVAEALTRWESDSRPFGVVRRFESDGERWLARFHSSRSATGISSWPWSRRKATSCRRRCARPSSRSRCCSSPWSRSGWYRQP